MPTLRISHTGGHVEVTREGDGPRQIDLYLAIVQLEACFQRLRSITVPQLEQVRFSRLE